MIIRSARFAKVVEFRAAKYEHSATPINVFAVYPFQIMTLGEREN